MRRTNSLWMMVVGALPGLWGATAVASSQMPPGVGVRLTDEGPVFVDARGMTLYKMLFGGPCTNRSETRLLHQADPDGSVNLDVSVPDVATRKTCAEKYPPLRAPSDARPIGQWSVQRREDGVFQWGYNGELLYTSLKDQVPGEINGSGRSLIGVVGTERSPWVVASAPLPGAPSGITTAQTVVGLALANFAGKTLYYSDQSDFAPDSNQWRPLVAPAGAITTALKEWSVVIDSGGTRQWAYRGKPLYTFMADSDSPRDQVLADIFGHPYGELPGGWHVALLRTGPGHPAEVTVHPIVALMDQHHQEKRVYATRSGMTLYTLQCIEDTADRLDCDDVGDSPRYWLSYCGGEQHCQETWHPLPAPPQARSIGDVWSVRVINPRHPWRAPQAQEALRVWAYRGRVVFAYSGDRRAGSCNGWNFQSGVVKARPIVAYEPLMAGAAHGALTAEQAQTVIEKRIASFREIGTAFKQIRDDLKARSSNVADMRAAAQLIRDRGEQMPQWFPRGSEPPAEAAKSWLDTILGWFSSKDQSAPLDESKSHAKRLIWEEPARFNQSYERFRQEAQRLDQMIQSGQTAAIAIQFARVGEACKACHDRYRERME